MEAPHSKELCIIGAGLVGSLLAVAMVKKGYKVDVYERYDDIRTIPSVGRSINLVLTSRGLRALRMISEEIAQEAIDMSTCVTGRVMHFQDEKEPFYQAYGRDEHECNHSISRYGLNRFLIGKAEAAGAKIHFGTKIKKIDFDGHALILAQEEGADKIVKFDRIIGADGAGSIVRKSMKAAGISDFTDNILNDGYKEVIFPADTSASLNNKGLHIWPRGDHFLMALANLDGSYTGTFYMPKKKKSSNCFDSLGKDPEKIKNFFSKYYADAVPLVGGMDVLVKQFINNAEGLLGTIYCEKYSRGSDILLIGDAAHAIVPFFGQGTNCGFEDVFVLCNLIDSMVGHSGTEADMAAAFSKYDEMRRPNCNAIAGMAMENYTEMMSDVADHNFNLMKEIENRIEKLYPEKFRSRYAMVCYGGLGNVTYQAAYDLGEIQKKILHELAVGLKPGESGKASMDKALQLIDQHLAPVQRQLGIDLLTVNHNLDISSAVSSHL